MVTEEGRNTFRVKIDNYRYDDSYFIIKNTPQNAWGCTFTDTDSLAVFGALTIQNQPFHRSYIDLFRVILFLSKEQINYREETAINPEDVVFMYGMNDRTSSLVATITRASVTVEHYDEEIIAGSFYIEGKAHLRNGQETEFRTDRAMFDVKIYKTGISLYEYPPSYSGYLFWWPEFEE